MSGRERFFAGILGALMPICAILLTLDLVNLFSENSGLSTGHLIGISLQFIIFLFVGGTVAYMHSDEVKAYKLFQIGMATPALLASFTTSNGLNSAITPTVDDATEIIIESPVTENGAFNFNIISPAHASDNPLDNVQTQQLAMGGQDSFFQQVIQGVTGSYTEKIKNKPKIEPKKATTNKKKEEDKKKESSNDATSSRTTNPPSRTTTSAASVSVPAVATTATIIAPSEVTVRAEEMRIDAATSARLMAIEEPAEVGTIEIRRLNNTETSTGNESSNDRYEQLMRKLQELESMQREIREEMRSLRPAG